jgi:hypothetical protein
VAASHLDDNPQFATQPSRHTDGMQAGDSIRAVANDDATHGDLLGRISFGHYRQALRWRAQEGMSSGASGALL